MILLLLMAGNGARFGSELPKQYHLLSGKKVYLRTLEAFLEACSWEKILLVADPSFHENIRKDLLDYSQHPIQIVEGGKTRQESVYKALLQLPINTSSVMVHDAVRPFITPKIILDNISMLQNASAVDTCIPCADTIIQTLDGDHIHAMGPRSQFWRGQTPQTFSFPRLLQAHKIALNDKIYNATDDCFLLHRLQEKVSIVPGDERNMKITTELDLFIAEQMMRIVDSDTASTISSLQGKVVVVTGGLGGIGSAICSLLQKQGAHAIALSRSSHPFSADLSCPEQTKAAFEKIHKTHGPIDALINSHGLLHIASLDEIDISLAKNLIDVNFSSVIYTCKFAKLQPEAHIINISSSSYFRGRKNFSLYSAAKSALVNFTQALADERPDLHIACLVPHRANTAMRQKHFPEENESDLLDPFEIARKVLELLQATPLRGPVIEIRKHP